jgi:hypothetical protein
MAWTSVLAIQLGNTTRTWTIGPHPSISTHDAIVPKPEIGSSHIEITSVRVRQGPTNYHVTVQVHGPDPVAFRLAAEQMD